MQECQHKQSMCDCIDWKKHDLDVELTHIRENFEFTGYELEYTTLEPEEGRRVCTVGRCRVCGKCLCIGLGLPDQVPADTLLASLYHWLYVNLVMPGLKQPDGAASFQETFLSLFHQSDQEYVREWMNRYEGAEPSRSPGEGS